MIAISRLRNPVQSYSWGSRSELASFLGRDQPTADPQAELWMGAHATAPSEIAIDGRWVPLTEVIRRMPDRILGPAVAERFGPTLPFLFKVLAAERALSIQAHPDALQAAAGYRRENRRSIPLAAVGRNYRDPRHKPEILYALQPFSALRGFRPAEEILELLRNFALARSLAEPCEALRAGDLKRFFEAYMAVDPRRLRELLPAALQRAAARCGGGPEVRWVGELQRQFPGDPGVLAPLFLHLIELRPGEAMFTGPGVLHAYLAGVGIELMANSDNVVRGGLTDKHVDVAELLGVLRFETDPPRLLEATDIPGGRRFETVAEEFALEVVEVTASGAHRRRADGVEILLCSRGAGVIREAGSPAETAFARGDSFLVPATVPGYRIEGSATLFRASVPLAGRAEGDGSRPAGG